MKKYWPFQKFYKTTLDIHESEIKQIKYLLYNFKDTCDVNQITTFQNINILNLPVLKNLKKQITDKLDTLNLSLSDNWGQLYLKDQKHEPHIHSNSVYSGVIYIDSEGTDGTNFIDSYSGVIFQERFVKNTLILFPSNVIHYVSNQDKDNKRLIISFNTKHKKT